MRAETTTLDGGDGLDTANYKPGASQDVFVDLASGDVADDGRGFADTVGAIERVEGAMNQENTLVGDAGPNKLIGGLLADFIAGGEGADLLRGEPERAPSGLGDTILGNEGSDVIFPGRGSNVVDAGQGAADFDTVDYGALAVASGVTVTVTDGNGSASGPVSDTLGSVENVNGTPNVDDHQRALERRRRLRQGPRGQRPPVTADGDALDVHQRRRRRRHLRVRPRGHGRRTARRPSPRAGTRRPAVVRLAAPCRYRLGD